MTGAGTEQLSAGRNLYQPTAQECLWLHGGGLALSRYFSRFLALQLKARMEGIPTPVHRPEAAWHDDARLEAVT